MSNFEVRVTTVTQFSAVLSLFAAFLFTASVEASDFHSPRTAALGGAGHASPLLNDAIVLNPSFAAFLHDRVSAGFNYLTYEGAKELQADGTFASPVNGKSYQVSLQDGRSPLFEAGVAYTDHATGSSIHLGASRPFIRRFGFGIGGKLLFNEDRSVMDKNINVSFTGLLMKEIQFALIADNLLENEGTRARGLLREITLGTKINILQLILIYLDPHYFTSPKENQDQWGLEAGIEIAMMSDMFLRFGRYKNSQIPWITNSGLEFDPYGEGYGMGIGWIGPKISFDFSFARTSVPIGATSYNMGATLYL